MLFIKEHSQGISFKVYVQPRSSKNMISGLYGDAIKVKLTAPPVDGAANKMCMKYLAKCLNVPVSSLELLSGHTGRTKHVLVKFTNKRTSIKELERIKQLIESFIISKKTA